MTIRRVALVALVGALAVAGVVALRIPGPAVTTATTRSSPPNVLLVITDDQRADNTLGVMPHVRRLLVSGGTHFSRAFATTPLCCPSRASILTGQYAHNHNVVNNADGSADRLDQETTLQRYLRDEGYLTGLFGKYLNSWDIAQTPPHFDRWSLMHGGYDDVIFNVQGNMRRIPGSSTDFITRQAIGFLERSEGADAQPWFAYIAVHAPHKNFQPEPRYAAAPVPHLSANPALSERYRSDKPPFVRVQNVTSERADATRRGQLRTLMSVDDLVGNVFSALERMDEASNTLAVFMSDNGFFWGEHRLTDKRLPYLQSTRIPLMLRWPKRVGAGITDPRLVANIDVTPTILEAVGIAPKHVVDGRSLLSPGHRNELLLEYMFDPGYGVPPWAALLSRRRQYVEYYADGGVSFRELYDLTTDKWQLRNLLETGGAVPPPRIHRRLALARSCSGSQGSNSCP